MIADDLLGTVVAAFFADSSGPSNLYWLKDGCLLRFKYFLCKQHLSFFLCRHSWYCLFIIQQLAFCWERWERILSLWWDNPMLHNNPTRQRKIGHHHPVLSWKWGSVPGLGGSCSQAQGLREQILLGGCCGLRGRVLASTVLFWGKSLLLLLWTKKGAFYNCLMEPQNSDLLPFRFKNHWNLC